MARWWAELWPANQPRGHYWSLAQVNLRAWAAQESWDTHLTDRTLMPESHIWRPLESLLRGPERSDHTKAYSHASDSSFFPPLAPIFCLSVFFSIVSFTELSEYCYSHSLGSSYQPVTLCGPLPTLPLEAALCL